MTAGRTALIASLLFLAGLARPAVAEDFYQNKTVTVLSAYTAGSAYFNYAQLVRAHLGRHLPGNPAVILKTMPGAAGMLVANYLYEVAPKDGTTIAGLSRGAGSEPLVEGTTVVARFDPRKFVWLGSLNNEVAVALTWHSTGVTTIDQARRTDVLVGNAGAAGDSSIFTRALNATLGTRFKLICCYPGSAEQDLAMERGETGARMNYAWMYLKQTHPDWLAEKKVNLLVQLALDKHADLPHVPLITDLVADADDRRVLEVIFSRQTMGRPFAAPPGTPAPQAALLRRAFAAMLADPEVIETANRQGLELNDPMSGERIDQLLAGLYGVSDEMRAKLHAIAEAKPGAN